MRSARRGLAASVLGLALLVPALPAAAQEAPPLRAVVTSSVSDRTVSLDASGSTGAVATYAWDLDGDSVFETDTGTNPRAERKYPSGTALVAGVRVTDEAGQSDTATVAVSTPAATRAAAPVPAAAPAASRQRSTEPTVFTAAVKAVTIRDFEFLPATVTIAAGDSVTWTNKGPSIHTATASDGSFDSGNLDQGQSFSHTFSKAGTYSYICTPHPFMKGRIVVTASGGGGGGSSGGGGGTTGGGGTSGGGSTGSGAATGGGTTSGLPQTGIDVLAWSLFGASMLAFGAALRWRLNTD